MSELGMKTDWMRNSFLKIEWYRLFKITKFPSERGGKFPRSPQAGFKAEVCSDGSGSLPEAPHVIAASSPIGT